MSDLGPELSVVISFRNEDAVIPELLRRLGQNLTKTGAPYEVIFVNDASTDGSLPLLADAARTDRRIKVLSTSRQFGPAECALAGLAFARGRAVVLMDADLQDPPELIPTLVERWREGADVVYTVRTARHGEQFLKPIFTRIAYRLVRAGAEIPLPVEAGDFRLMSRRVVDEVLKLPERSPYLRGLVTWIGFRQVSVPYERQPRFAGRTHSGWFRSRNPWRTLQAGLTFSSGPLTALLSAGLVIFAASVAGAAIVWIVTGTMPLSVLIAVSLGLVASVQLIGLGVLGLYVGRIADEVRGRPRYIIESAIGFDDAGDRCR
jgi:glycosyltransferase involved in cell wall biosynthesis